MRIKVHKSTFNKQTEASSKRGNQKEHLTQEHPNIDWQSTRETRDIHRG